MPERSELPDDTGAGTAVASVWLVFYVAILAALLFEHYPGAAIDVATAASP